jgi:predicted ATPase/class 3 adenylate cyclase/Tfp pilus assembly protein PilF
MSDETCFGRWLQRRRKALDLTQGELARRVGCAVETLRKIEADARRPSRQIAERLADALELPKAEGAAFVRAARPELSVDRLAPPTQHVSEGAFVAAAALPRGTITFLFTDIEGSTQLWEQHPVAMREALAHHDALLRQVIQAHGGVIFKTVGDGVHAAFARAPDALAAAIEAQGALHSEAWGATGPLRVRMALHTGVAEERDGDYFGPPLNRAARLMLAGHGGQLLLTRATQELVCDTLPAEVALRDLGTHHLKDLTRREHIFQVSASALPADFPPLRTLDSRPHNLPAQLTPLIGRAEEVVTVCDRLRRAGVRLLTLTGAGGIGKTRLALQVGAEVLDDFADGVYFVDLAPVSDPSLVASTIAQALGLQETGDQPLVERLTAYLKSKQLLLVLDNFEHIVDAAALVEELLVAAPHLKVLITSRMVLHLYGEHEIVVPLLAVPDPTRLPPLNRLSQYDAVRLFIERAQAVKADFTLTNVNAPAVAAICARLDGLPLAIELAAVRTKLFAPDALLTRLSSRLQLLTGGARTLPARQQTLRNTIDWSYNLLDMNEQRLFTRLGIFVGSSTLEAVEAICNAHADLGMEVLDGLASLVDKSLLRPVEASNNEARFTMLETIREYALERLEACGEAGAVQRQYAAYYLRLVEQAEPQLWAAEQGAWLAQLDREHDHLRALLAWSQTSDGDLQLGLQLVGALWPFWHLRGYMSEGGSWLAGLLARPHHSDAWSSMRAKALYGAGVLATDQGDYIRAVAFCDESLTLFRDLGDQLGMAWSLNQLAFVALNQGYDVQATVHSQESLALFRDLGDQRGIAQSLDHLGRLVRNQGDYKRATTLFQASLILFREVGDQRGVANSIRSLGNMAWTQGDYAAAHTLFEESLRLFGELGDNRGTALALTNLGLVAREQGDYATARTFFEESLTLQRELGNKNGIAHSLFALGTVAYRQGDDAGARALLEESLELFHRVADLAHLALTLAMLARLASVGGAEGQLERAARLLGAVEALCEIVGMPLPWVRSDYERGVGSAQMDEAAFAAAFAAAWAAGRAMSLEQAIAEALSQDD